MSKIVLLIVPIAVLALIPPRQRSASPEVLLAADRAFAADVAEGGADAWASWFAADGAMIQPGVGEVRGRDAIHEFMGVLDDPTFFFAALGAGPRRPRRQR